MRRCFCFLAWGGWAGLGLSSSGRWTPAFFDLKIALDNSRLNQTYNTPALATIHLLASQIKWFNDNGGLEFSAGRSKHPTQLSVDSCKPEDTLSKRFSGISARSSDYS